MKEKRIVINMERNYFKFIVAAFISAMALSLLLIYLVFYIIDGRVDQIINGFALLQVAIYVGAITTLMVIVSGLFSFLVCTDSEGIKVGLSGKKIAWSEVQKIRIVGIPKIKSFNRMIISGVGVDVEVKLFIFKNQEDFLGKLVDYLPWANSLDITALPSEVSKR